MGILLTKKARYLQRAFSIYMLIEITQQQRLL